MQLAAQFKAAAASSVVVSGGGRLLGYSLQENAGTPAAAAVTLYDGISAGGEVLHKIGIPLSGVVNPWFGPQGINFRAGLFIGPYTGSLTGVLYFVTEETLSRNLGVRSNAVNDQIFEKMTLAEFLRITEELR